MSTSSTRSAKNGPFYEGVKIAVMGAAGSGKTTFVSLLSNIKRKIGDSNGAWIDEVHAAGSFSLDGQTITLIDTPGFDDTNISEGEVMRRLVHFMTTTYGEDSRLNGVIYMHNITDTSRVGGISRRSFRQLSKLCGDSALWNVRIVTNMWGKVDHATGEAREQDLAANGAFYKSAIDRGARVVRHDNTRASAQNIIRTIMGSPPDTPEMQHEKTEAKGSLAGDYGGEFLPREWVRKSGKYREEVEQLKATQEVAASSEIKTQKELCKVKNALAEALERLKEVEEERDVLRGNTLLEGESVVQTLTRRCQEQARTIESMQIEHEALKQRLGQLEQHEHKEVTVTMHLRLGDKGLKETGLYIVPTKRRFGRLRAAVDALFGRSPVIGQACGTLVL